MIFDAPFSIGDVYWLEAGPSEKKTVECPMCSGNKYVTVTLGNGEKYELECEACRLGYIGSQGVITEYDVTPRAEQFKIEKVAEWRDGKWRVEGPTGLIVYFDSLYATEAEALAASEKHASDREDENMANRRKKKYRRVSSWTILYHQRQIADCEKQIAWHRAHIHAKGSKDNA